MKTITLLLNRIKQFALRNKVIFILFILIGVLNSAMFTYLYGNVNPMLTHYNSTLYVYRRYEVIFTWEVLGQNGRAIHIISPDKNYVSDEDVKRLIETDLFEIIELESMYAEKSHAIMYDDMPLAMVEPPADSVPDDYMPYIPPQPGYNPYDDPNFVIPSNWPQTDPTKSQDPEEPQEPDPEPAGQTETPAEEPEQLPESLFTCVYGDPAYMVIENGSREFTSDDQVVITDNVFSSVGKKVSIRGEEYEVIGIGTDSRANYYISSEKYRQLEPFTNHIILYSKERWHLNNDVPAKTLESMFPGAKIDYPPFEEYDTYSAKQMMPSVLIHYAITQIAFILLLDYLTSLLSEENAVSLIVGGRPADITVMAILEGVILSVIAIVIGLAIHILLYKDLFSKFTDTFVEYKPVDYVIILLAMVIISTVLMILRSLKYLRVSPFKLRGKES